MSDPAPDETNDIRLGEIASRFTYPPTPDLRQNISVRISRRGWRPSAWQVVVLVLLLLLAIGMIVPQARALISGYFQIGGVRIFPVPPTETSWTTLTAARTPTIFKPNPSATNVGYVPVGATLEPLPSELVGLAGRTSLIDAQANARFPVLVPTYPLGLGIPDFVFYQASVPMLILAWKDPSQSGELFLSLYAIDSSSPIISKFEPDVIQETTVNGRYAVWAKGPYLVELTTQGFDLRRLVEGNSLIWQENGITYRLESGLPLDEVIKIAESLQPLEP